MRESSFEAIANGPRVLRRAILQGKKQIGSGVSPKSRYQSCWVIKFRGKYTPFDPPLPVRSLDRLCRRQGYIFRTDLLLVYASPNMLQFAMREPIPTLGLDGSSSDMPYIIVFFNNFSSLRRRSMETDSSKRS
jgi:hypothetical protein